jgi:iron complex outermembrane receptor protein
MMMRRAYLIGMSAFAFAAASPAYAQDSAAQAPADETVDDANVIIVTASKRSTSLAETPIAVSVTSAETIEQAQIRDLIDLQSVVPSLRVSQNQNSAATTFLIRGFGNGANNPGIEPSVGVFIDGVYRSRSAAQITDLPNIERVEVLRGPQSTLFGKNASAGVISVVTQKPQFDFGGSASFTYGNFNTIIAKADITGPISDSIAFSLSGDYSTRDGYVRDLNLGTKINDRDRWSVRGQLLFAPGDALEVRVIGDYSKIDELCCAASNILAGPTIAATNAVIGGPSVVVQDPYSDTVRLNRTPANEIENYGVSAQIDYDFGDLSLTSISAYREVRANTVDDSDFTAADLIRQDAQTAIDTFTQEIRIASDFDGPLNFLLGGYYFDESINFRNNLDYGVGARPYFNLLSGGAIGTVEAILGRPVGTTFSQPGQGITDNFLFDNKSYSLFGTVDFDVTDRLTLTAGFNYTNDKKKVVSNVVNDDPFSAIDFVALGVAIGVPANLANNPQFNPLLGLRPLQFLPPFLNYPNAVEDGRTKDSDWSYTLRAAYKVSDNVNAYATYATGFKASSFNLSRDSRPFASDFIPGSSASVPAPGASPIRGAGLALPNLTTGTRYAGPESAEVYEIGIKGSFPRVAFNLALFDQTIKGFQGNSFTGTGFVLSNAGSQSTRGFEFDGSVTPVDPLTIFLGVTYLDAKFDSFLNSAVGDISGQEVAGVSPITMSVGATFTQEFGGGTKFILRGDYHYESETQVVQGLPGFITSVGGVPNFNAAIAVGRRFTREVNSVNASATLQLQNGVELSAYVRNLTNDRYLTAIFDGVGQAGSVYGYTNQPRTYGATARYRF